MGTCKVLQVRELPREMDDSKHSAKGLYTLYAMVLTLGNPLTGEKDGKYYCYPIKMTKCNEDTRKKMKNMLMKSNSLGLHLIRTNLTTVERTGEHLTNTNLTIDELPLGWKKDVDENGATVYHYYVTEDGDPAKAA